MSELLRLDVFRSLFESVSDEMGSTLGRASSSVNIKERRDYSCAIFDGEGRMISQAAHIPVHLGSMPLSVEAAIRDVKFAPGDVAIVNDPYRGGTHLPDVTLVHPIYLGGRLRFFAACRAHYSDIGGMSPGSMPLSTDVWQEGFLIPPMKLDASVRKLLLANVRLPREVEGDLDAQVGACVTGRRRIEALAARYGVAELLRRARQLQDHARLCMEAAIRRIPRGTHRFEDRLDSGVRIRVAIRRKGSGAEVDFTGSSPQSADNTNAVFAVTASAVLYAFRCLVPEEIPLNSGSAAPIRIVAPEGTIVNARPPAAVAAGNVETSQRIVDALLGALARALPGRIPAASQGTMNNVAFGGAGFAYYETLAGGMGARRNADGPGGVHSHMTNTLNTPIEALERSGPVRVLRYALRKGSGGRGRTRGGDGLVREYEFLEPLQVSILGERRTTAPWGLKGGKPGKQGVDRLNGRRIPARATFAVKPGDRLAIETPGGGGYGKA
jgi:N-methylhydantoinase B